MIHSLGVDLVEISRIKRAIERYRKRFIERVYTPTEIRYCQFKFKPEVSFAARFAAKEAVLKALGTGITAEGGFRSVEIVNDELGKPQVKLREGLSKMLNDKRIIVSLSHTDEYAIAQAILVSDGEDAGYSSHSASTP